MIILDLKEFRNFSPVYIGDGKNIDVQNGNPFRRKANGYFYNKNSLISTKQMEKWWG